MTDPAGGRHRGIRPDLAQVAARCAQLGVPLTVQRRAIYALLAERRDHPTADELHVAVHARCPGISKATTYRTLDKLVELGLVRRVAHPGAMARFDAMVHRHHHLVCDRCGAVRDLESAALDRVALPDLAGSGFEASDFSVLVHGRCERCARRESAQLRIRSGAPGEGPAAACAGPRPSRPSPSRLRRKP